MVFRKKQKSSGEIIAESLNAISESLQRLTEVVGRLRRKADEASVCEHRWHELHGCVMIFTDNEGHHYQECTKCGFKNYVKN